MVKVFNMSGKSVSEVNLPKIFSTEQRLDLIKRAVLAIQSKNRQAYGADTTAGFRTSAHYHGNRHSRYSMMNKEMARLPRVHGHTSPAQSMRAMRAPHVVSGRKAHPPKAEKKWEQKINKKELRLALKSAIACTSDIELVKNRGHKVSDLELPIVVSGLEEVKKTKDVEKLLLLLKLKDELKRSKVKKVRPGKGKMRGRKYKRKVSVLFVTEKDVKAMDNLSGMDACKVGNLNVELLAPGTIAGRLVIWSEEAINVLEKL